MENRRRCFNTTGACDPKRHYMVDIQNRLQEIKRLVDEGKYFTMNRARQYGKTTTLRALTEYIRNDYVVLSLDFQKIGNYKFADEHVFSMAFAERLLRKIGNRRDPITGLDKELLEQLGQEAKANPAFSLMELFDYLSDLCDTAQKPVVLIIDEADSAANNQVFLDFLAQLRAYYLDRDMVATFQSVILAGVYDVKNIRRKIRPDEEHKVNSPWNIAAAFDVDMSFSVNDIQGMLNEYEADHHTGMDTAEIAGLLFDYTSGYPFLVSRLCELLDTAVAGSGNFPDEKAAWTKQGFLEAEKLFLAEKNSLFESLISKLTDYPDLCRKVYAVLFHGTDFVYNPDDPAVDMAMMFGFLKRSGGTLKIANRIFETRLYNYFLTTLEAQHDEMFGYASEHKPQFIRGGRLDMELVLKKFVEHFDLLYGNNVKEFDEDEGRRRFLLYLRPIINGTGNYYIEPETRDSRRMDVVVDYRGEQYIVEMKVWRGNAYNERGEKQLSDYLDYFGLKKGYMLSYNFNKKKQTGLRKIQVGDRLLIEAVV